MVLSSSSLFIILYFVSSFTYMLSNPVQSPETVNNQNLTQSNETLVGINETKSIHTTKSITIEILSGTSNFTSTSETTRINNLVNTTESTTPLKVTSTTKFPSTSETTPIDIKLTTNSTIQDNFNGTSDHTKGNFVSHASTVVDTISITTITPDKVEPISFIFSYFVCFIGVPVFVLIMVIVIKKIYNKWK